MLLQTLPQLRKDVSQLRKTFPSLQEEVKELRLGTRAIIAALGITTSEAESLLLSAQSQSLSQLVADSSPAMPQENQIGPPPNSDAEVSGITSSLFQKQMKRPGSGVSNGSRRSSTDQCRLNVQDPDGEFDGIVPGSVPGAVPDLEPEPPPSVTIESCE